MLYKDIFSTLAIIITLIAFCRYAQLITQNRINPHVFSWLIWAITTLIIFSAQLTSGAGVGAWPIGLSGLMTALIAVLAYRKRTDISITTSDWICFLAALAAMPLWLITADPTLAVILLTSIDLLGFGPTLRQAFSAPDDESLFFFSAFALRNALVVLAVEHYAVATIFFPAVIGLACVIVITVILVRRNLQTTTSS